MSTYDDGRLFLTAHKLMCMVCAPFSSRVIQKLLLCTILICLAATETSTMRLRKTKGHTQQIHPFRSVRLSQSEGHLTQTQTQTLGLKAVLEESVASAIAAVDLKLLLVLWKSAAAPAAPASAAAVFATGTRKCLACSVLAAVENIRITEKSST